jgi:hypothetical protein
MFTRSCVLCALFTIIALGSRGQDIIRTKKKIIKARVEEIGVNEIKYRDFDDPTGQLIEINKRDVLDITYQNGQKEEFPHAPKRPDVFVNDKNTIPVSCDVGFGFGFTGSGVATHISFSIDFKHFYASIQSTSKSGLSNQSIHESSYLFGYRFRNSVNMFCIAGGFGETEFKCTSGLNFDCYNYVEGSYKSYPFLMEYDWITNRAIAFGIQFNTSFCEREDVTGILGIIKIGLFR